MSLFKLKIVDMSGCKAYHSVEVYLDRTIAIERKVALLKTHQCTTAEVVESVVGQEINICVEDMR